MASIIDDLPQWLHPDLVKAALPKGRTFVADPKVDPITQMRQVYSSDMYVLMFQDGTAADDAMNRDPRGSLRNSYRKNLITSAAWNKLPPEVANMEYYGQPLPDKLPGRDVSNAQELNVYVGNFQRTGFTPSINWYRNLSRNWKAGLNVDQTIRVPSMMVSAANDVVLRPGMADGMDAYVTNLEKHVVADCWHWTPEEKPEELNRLTISWLRRRFPSKQPPQVDPSVGHTASHSPVLRKSCDAPRQSAGRAADFGRAVKNGCVCSGCEIVRLVNVGEQSRLFRLPAEA